MSKKIDIQDAVCYHIARCLPRCRGDEIWTFKYKPTGTVYHFFNDIMIDGNWQSVKVTVNKFTWDWKLTCTGSWNESIIPQVKSKLNGALQIAISVAKQRYLVFLMK